MKLKNKLLLISILFLGFILLDTSYSYCNIEADYINNLPEIVTNNEKCISYLGNRGYYLVFSYVGLYDGNKYIVACNSNLDNLGFVFEEYNNRFYLGSYLTSSVSEPYDKTTFYNGYYHYIYRVNEDNSFTEIKKNYGRFDSNEVDIATISILYQTDIGFPVLYHKVTPGNPTKYDVWNENIFANKINLYELNLTDMDYNNQEHLFNICTYTNSPCYNEIMDCYNRDLRYAIWIDDYTRTLTYGEENNDNSFMYGSYMLSGHIDYLMEDSAFFYFDERTKSVKSNSGRLRDGSLQLFTNEEAYTKRFYFNLVYSEDSNDPDQIIWSDNGDLALGNFEENNNALCFVGSSHNIRYSHYKRLAGASWLPETNFLQLDDSYYYVGYMGSTVHRDVTTVPFYHYDFYFYGGTTKLLFANSATFKEDKKKRYDELADNYSKNKGKRQEDSSDGGSGIKGKGSSSSTYDRDQINEDSTQDDLDDNSDGYRGTEKTDRDGADKEEDDKDRTGFHFLNTLNKIKDKFNFVGNITKNANDIKNFVENTQETHKYYLNINHKYLNGNICIIDLSWYAPYKSTVDAYICAFAYLAFIWHMFCKIPDLIHGASATNYVSDISSYINKRG